VCPILPEIPPPNPPACHIGLLSCLGFILIVVYVFAVTGFAGGYGILLNMKKRRNQLGRIALSNGNDTPSSGLVGATSLATYYDDSASDTRQSLGRGVSLLDHEGFHPRRNRLSTFLRRFFYRVGYASATSPLVTFFVACTFIAISNGGWKFFDIEKDPVRLWVSPSSESRVQKEFFDQHFGPAYRFEQIFVTPSASTPHAPGMRTTANPGDQWSDHPVLSYDLLQWWLQVESNIRSLRSREHGYSLEDVCLKPSGPDGSCVVQSIAAWLGNDLEKYNADTWASRIVHCANTPAECLPDFGQPIRPEYVLGGIPNSSAPSRWLDARSLVITYVVSDSMHSSKRSKVEEWEVELRRYLESLSNQAPAEVGVQVLFTTGVSLEEELNKSSNTDVKTVILSYLFMFFYVSLTLGRGDGEDRPGPGYIAVIRSWFTRSRSGPMSSASSGTSYRGGQGLLRRVFVGSKAVLGSVGLLLVMISVASSVGIFSYLGVKMTLVIAEALPFLVLAVGVDNVFLLLGELDRQNSSHGPNASAILPSASMATPMSPSQRRSPFGSNMDSAEADSGPAYLSPEERVARAIAKIGPSILMSAGTQTFAFGLGALVPMPAVRNFALYAALSVLLNALLQITVFVSAMTLDLRRAEVHHDLY
jgi:Niemann-Pick C1 protein